MTDNEQLQCAADVRREAMEEPSDTGAEVARLTMLANMMTLAMGQSVKRIHALEAALREIAGIGRTVPTLALDAVIAIARAALAEPKCLECEGEGRVPESLLNSSRGYVVKYVPCPSCEGEQKPKCPECGDSGEVESWGSRGQHGQPGPDSKPCPSCGGDA